jgi:hypothetical protein
MRTPHSAQCSRTPSCSLFLATALVALTLSRSVHAQAPTASHAPSAASSAAPAKADSTKAVDGEPAPMTAAELEKMLDATRKGNVEERTKAAHEVQNLGFSALSAIRAKLTESRMGGTGAIQTVLRARKEEAGGRDTLDGFDGVVALLKLKKQDFPGYKNTLTTALLIETLHHMASGGTHFAVAVREMVALTDDHAGAFRPDITRRVTALGELAIPGLIEGRRVSPDVRRWAVLQLEGMGKKSAGDAVQVKSSQVLCEILRAYGQIHDLDAIPVVLSFANSDRQQVRAAAREAIKLYAGEGLWKLREQYMNLTGKPSPDGWSAEQTAKELFAAYDRVRLQEVYDILDAGLQKQKDGKSAEAVAEFDKALAREPMLDRRKEMISGYIAYADGLEESDTGKKLEIYKKCARLDPEESRGKLLSAHITFLETRKLSEQGLVDVDGYQRVLALDPNHSGARMELDKLTQHKEQTFEKSRRWIAGVAVLLLGLFAIVIFGRTPKTASE